MQGLLKKQMPTKTSISYFLKHPPKQVAHIFWNALTLAEENNLG